MSHCYTQVFETCESLSFKACLLALAAITMVDKTLLPSSLINFFILFFLGGETVQNDIVIGDVEKSGADSGLLENKVRVVIFNAFFSSYFH